MFWSNVSKGSNIPPTDRMGAHLFQYNVGENKYE